MPMYRVTFSKELFGLPFPVAEISVIEAQNEDRASRAATLRFMRRHGIADWRVRADRIEIERQPGWLIADTRCSDPALPSSETSSSVIGCVGEIICR